MKKILSIFLCVAMLASMFTSTVITASAVGNAKQFLTVSTDGFADDKITYKISLKPNQTKVTGVIVQAVYDSAALEVVEEETHAAGELDDNGEIIPVVPGIYAVGKVYDNVNAHSLAYLSDKGYTVGTAAAEIFQITFRAISADRADATVDFKCVEFITDDGNEDNNIDRTKEHAPQIFDSDTFHTLSIPTVTEVNSYYDGLKVVWALNEGADKYHLYRKSANEPDWTLIASDITDTFYVDEGDNGDNNGVRRGLEYSYTVSAENEACKTDYNTVGLSGMNFGNIESISAVEATDGSGAIISWSALNGAENYGVYRKLAVADEQGWQLIANVEGTNYSDKTAGSGIEYNYKVRAFQGQYSADMICDVPTFMFIAAPDTTVKNTFGGIEISFIPSNGAESYIVEKKTGSGEFTEYKTILASEIEGDKYSLIDESVVTEESYTYTIQALASEYESVKKTLDAVKRLSNTTITEISNNSKGVSLSWNAVADATQYEIYRKTTAENSVYDEVGTTTQTTFVDTRARSGYEYIYSVVAKNETGNGDYSVNEMQIVYLSTPIVNSISSNNEGITLEWSKVNGATAYNIYRKTADTAWTVIATVEDTSYTNLLTDPTFEKAKIYNYTVEAVEGEYKSAKNETGVEGMHFGVVDNLKVTTSGATATLTWDKIPADTYIVYRRTVGSTSWGEPIATGITGTSYIDTTMSSGVTYEYKVNAKKGNTIADMVCPVASAKILFAPVITVKNVGPGLEIGIESSVNGADKYIIEKFDGAKYNKIAEITNETSFYYVDDQVEAKVTYSYRAYALTSDDLVKSAYSNVKSVKRITSPDILTIENTIEGVEFTWEPIEGVIGYKVYRKTASDKNWVIIDIIGEDDYGKIATTYQDERVDGGTKYSYAVAAVTADNGNTDPSDKGAKSITFMETPDLDYVENVSTGISVSWWDVTGADSYILYRKTGKSSWTRIAIVSDTTYIDKNVSYGVTYTYTVRARAADGAAGWYDTDGVSVVSTTLAPTKVTLSNYASGVTVKWTKVTGAKYYYVYRKYGKGSWAIIAKLPSTKLAYNDTAVNKQGGKVFSYTVRAVNGSKASAFSEYKILRLYNPKATLSNYATGIQVKWNAVAGAKGYVVYRKYGSSGWVVIAKTAKCYWNDTGVNKHGGKTFSYAVRAVNGSNMSSYTACSAKRLYAPTLASVKSAKAGITFTWKAVTGASGYIVYRKTGNGGWAKLTTVNSGKTVKFLDKSAKKGYTYTYTVRAYSGSSTSAYNKTGLKCKDKY